MKTMELYRKILPLILVTFLFLSVWIIYSLQAAQKSSIDYDAYYVIDENATVSDCLVKSHEISAEGILAREAAMQSFSQSVNDWLIRSGIKIINCFK